MKLYDMINRNLCLQGVLFLLSMMLGGASYAGQMEEQLIKMALVYKIGKFVEWPAEHKGADRFTICAVGDKQRVAVFKSLENKRMGGLPITISLSADANKSFDHCHILYIDGQLESALSYQQLIGKAILTISDAGGFAERQGIVGLSRQQSKIKIYINLKNGKKQRLIIHAPLLQLSTVIED